jgi:hypothetical protein
MSAMSEQKEIQDSKAPVKDAIRKMVWDAFTNDGYVEDGKRWKVKDLLQTTDATMFMPKVISQVVKEAVEPVLVMSKLFQTIRLNQGRSIEFPAIGALTAEDVGEGMPYPEKQLDMGGGNVVSIAVTKSGLMVRVTEEMIEDSQWDVIGLHLRAAGRALARHKELKCATQFSTYGYKVFDNAEPTASVIGTTTGRKYNGDFNGGIHLEDLFDMIGYLINSGFNPNTIIMHPLAWIMMAKDPLLREMSWMNGMSWQGGKTSGEVGQTGWNGSPNLLMHTYAPNLSTTQTAIPSSVFPMPLSILVSPYVRFVPKGANVYKQSDGLICGATTVTAADGKALFPLTDIYLIDANEMGVIVQKDDVSTEEFVDPLKDIKNLKIRERYGLGLLSQGKAVTVARNIAVVQTRVFTPVTTAVSIAEQTRNI